MVEDELSPIDYLFTLRGREREAFHTIIDSVNTFLAQENSATERLVDILRIEQSINSALQEHDPELIDAIKHVIAQILEDDASLALLAEKLNDYKDRVIAATMLGWFRSRAKEVIPDLIDLAGWPGNATEAAKQAILLIGHAESEVMSALRKSVLDSDDGGFRELWDLAVRAGYSSLLEFQDIVRMAVQSRNPHLREAAADAIWRLDTADKQRFASILDLLKNDPYEHVRLVHLQPDFDKRSFCAKLQKK